MKKYFWINFFFTFYLFPFQLMTEAMEANKKPNESSGQSNVSAVDRDKVKSEREAKRLAKQAAKQKLQDKNRNFENESGAEAKPKAEKSPQKKQESTKPKQNSPQQQKQQKAPVTAVNAKKAMSEVTEQMNQLQIQGSEKQATKQLSKAERRALQETQRAAKAAKATPSVSLKTTAAVQNKAKTTTSTKTKVTETTSKTAPIKSPSKSTSTGQHRVKLVNHLYCDRSPEQLVNSSEVHPAIVRLGTQYANGVVKGSNARCLAFMNAMKLVIEDFETPSQKVFSRALDETIDVSKNYLDKCRPVAVSIANAIKFIKWQLNQLPKNESDSQLKSILVESIDTYIRDQIDKAAEAISIQVQEKISDGDVILTFGCSSVVQNILDEAKKNTRDFRVIVVDARPWHEGQEMLRRLVAKNIKCTCVLINAVGFIMPEVTKVLLGAHALLANGYVMSRAGTAQVALIAKSYNVPVLECCETHKFSERVLTDAFVYNEIGKRPLIV